MSSDKSTRRSRLLKALTMIENVKRGTTPGSLAHHSLRALLADFHQILQDARLLDELPAIPRAERTPVPQEGEQPE